MFNVIYMFFVRNIVFYIPAIILWIIKILAWLRMIPHYKNNYTRDEDVHIIVPDESEDQKIKRFMTSRFYDFEHVVAVPKIINGSYIRLCAGNNIFNSAEFHLFIDSVASIFRIDFDNGVAKIKYKQLNTQLAEYIKYTGAAYFAVTMGNILTGNSNSIFNLLYFQNNNVVPFMFKNKYYLTTDVYPWVEYDFDSNKITPVYFDSYLSCENVMSCAHPIVMENKVISVSYVERIIGGSTDIIVFETTDMKKRKIITSIKNVKNHYIHQISACDKYIIVPLQPYIVYSIGILIGNPLLESTKSLQFAVVDSNTGDYKIYDTSFNCKIFHIVNSYINNGDIIIDFIGYVGVNLFSVFDLVNFKYVKDTILIRCVINKKGVNVHKLLTAVELPFYDKRLEGKFYRYAYFLRAEDGFSIIKYDYVNKNILSWKADKEIVSEPVFVSTGKKEDDGYIMTNMHSMIDNMSYMIILDAQTMTLINKFPVNGKVPIAIHAGFFKKN